MCTSETYLKIQNSAMDVLLDKLVEHIEKAKICPVCKTECDIRTGKVMLVYTCPRCGTLRTDRL